MKLYTYFKCGCRVPTDKARYLRRGEIKKLRAKGITDKTINASTLVCFKCGGRFEAKDIVCIECGEVFRTEIAAKRTCPDCESTSDSKYYYDRRNQRRKKPKVVEKTHQIKCPQCKEIWIGTGPMYQYCKKCEKLINVTQRCSTQSDYFTVDPLEISLQELRMVNHIITSKQINAIDCSMFVEYAQVFSVGSKLVPPL